MPFGMFSYPEVVVLEGKVYIGGGSSISGREDHIVMVYDTSCDDWSTLPPYKFHLFAMTVVNGKLVLVGGADKQSDKKTNMLGVWNKERQGWVDNKFPPMHTARSGAAVVTHNNRWIMVAGGCGNDKVTSTSVEILDTSAGQWYHASAPLPQQLYKMSSAKIGNVWYLLGGYCNTRVLHLVLSISLDNLISQVVITTPVPLSLPWQSLPDTPLAGSTALAFKGALLAVGGEQEVERGSSAIHLYHCQSRRWMKVGELPTERKECGCMVLPSGEVFIVGGLILPFMEQVDIGRVIL